MRTLRPDVGMGMMAALALAGWPAPSQAQPSAAANPDAAAERNLGAQNRALDPHRAPDEPGRADRVTDTEGGHDPRVQQARADKLTDQDIATAPVREMRRMTRHTAVIAGKPMAYTAVAGTLTLRDDEGKPTASMFYVAYLGGDGKNTRRPVTFFYNGGPGSSTVWLHMGSLGPRRVLTDSPEATHNAPFQMVDNDDSLLDKSDLVFLDAIGTGYSRPLGDTKLQAFWGTDPDIDAFARGIERFLTDYDRWNSPKFLFGESYGTTRSAGLSYRLQQDGAQLNGVVLLSSILNYGRRDPGFDRELVNYIPSYAATAAYHNRLATPPTDLPAFLQQARAWAAGPYAEALAAGDTLPQAQRQAIAQQMAGFIGLSPQVILNSNLRVELNRFRKELLRDQRRTLGRYDARFTGMDVDAGGESAEYDPSDTGMSGAFVSSFRHYIVDDLDFRTDLDYRPTYYSNNGSLHWSFDHKAPGARGETPPTPADVALDLSAALRENPHLRLFSMNGVYDMATPFFGTEYDLAHMQLEPSVVGNVSFAYYPSGHMVYLNPTALTQMKRDLVRFYDQAAPADPGR